MAEYQPPQQAAEVVGAAVRRLEEAGLIDRVGEAETAVLNGDGMRTLMDTLVLWNIHTQGEGMPGDWELSHDLGVAFAQAINLCVFADADDATKAEVRRRTVTALRRAAKKHKY